MAFNFTNPSTGTGSVSSTLWDKKLHPEKYQRNTTQALPDPTGTPSSYEAYKPPGADSTGSYANNAPANQYSDEAWQTWRDNKATPGYTPEQIATMRSQALNANASAQQGMTEKIREMMASQGLGGSGMGDAMMARQMLGSGANLQNSLNQQQILALVVLCIHKTKQ